MDSLLSPITPSHTTCYVSNLAQTSPSTLTELAALFGRFGSVLQVHERSGSAVVEMDTHENAATAMAELTRYGFHGRPLHCSWCGPEDAPSAEAGSSSGYPSNPPTPKIPFYTKADFPASPAARIGSAERQQLKLDEIRQMMIQAHKMGFDIEKAGYSTYATACLAEHLRNDKAPLVTPTGQASPPTAQPPTLPYTHRRRKQSSLETTPSRQHSRRGASGTSPLRNEITPARDGASPVEETTKKGDA